VEHQPTKIVGNKPITIGQGFGTLAWIPEEVGRLRRALGLRLGPKAQSSRWALPLLHERITSAETPIERGAANCGEYVRSCLFGPSASGIRGTAMPPSSMRVRTSLPTRSSACGPTSALGPTTAVLGTRPAAGPWGQGFR